MINPTQINEAAELYGANKAKLAKLISRVDGDNSQERIDTVLSEYKGQVGASKEVYKAASFLLKGKSSKPKESPGKSEKPKKAKASGEKAPKTDSSAGKSKYNIPEGENPRAWREKTRKRLREFENKIANASGKELAALEQGLELYKSEIYL